MCNYHKKIMGYVMGKWRFYVYEIFDAENDVIYVGKGSGDRLRSQIRYFSAQGREVARFKREHDAYAFEIQRIAEVKPTLNILKGGNGSRAQKIRQKVQPQWVRNMERIGTRIYAARFLMQHMAYILKAKLINLTVSEVEKIRRIAYGEGI